MSFLAMNGKKISCFLVIYSNEDIKKGVNPHSFQVKAYIDSATKLKINNIRVLLNLVGGNKY